MFQKPSILDQHGIQWWAAWISLHVNLALQIRKELLRRASCAFLEDDSCTSFSGCQGGRFAGRGTLMFIIPNKSWVLTRGSLDIQEDHLLDDNDYCWPLQGACSRMVCSCKSQDGKCRAMSVTGCGIVISFLSRPTSVAWPVRQGDQDTGGGRNNNKMSLSFAIARVPARWIGETHPANSPISSRGDIFNYRLYNIALRCKQASMQMFNANTHFSFCLSPHSVEYDVLWACECCFDQYTSNIRTRDRHRWNCVRGEPFEGPTDDFFPQRGHCTISEAAWHYYCDSYSICPTVRFYPCKWYT